MQPLTVWTVWILNNYYAGKFYEWGARPFHVLATSEEEAKQVVLDNREDILDILKQKRISGRKLLSKKYTLPIEKLGKVTKGTLTATSKKIDFFSPNGIIKAQIIDKEVIK